MICSTLKKTDSLGHPFPLSTSNRIDEMEGHEGIKVETKRERNPDEVKGKKTKDIKIRSNFNKLTMNFPLLLCHRNIIFKFVSWSIHQHMK